MVSFSVVQNFSAFCSMEAANPRSNESRGGVFGFLNGVSCLPFFFFFFVVNVIFSACLKVNWRLEMKMEVKVELI